MAAADTVLAANLHQDDPSLLSKTTSSREDEFRSDAADDLIAWILVLLGVVGLIHFAGMPRLAYVPLLPLIPVLLYLAARLRLRLVISEADACIIQHGWWRTSSVALADVLRCDIEELDIDDSRCFRILLQTRAGTMTIRRTLTSRRLVDRLETIFGEKVAHQALR